MDNRRFQVILEGSKVSKCEEPDEGEGEQLCRALQNMLEDCSDNERTLKIAITKTSRSICDTLSVSLGGEMLLRLLYTLGDEVKLQVEISNAAVEIPSPNLNEAESIKSTSQPLRLHTSSAGLKSAHYQSQINCPIRWKSYWDHYAVKFFGTLKIKLGGSFVMHANAATPVTPSWANKIYSSTQLENIKKMLEGENEMDAVIVASDGTERPCHRAVFTSHSPVLKSMLEGKFKEAKTKRIEMPDMSSPAVKEFIAFLYYWDLDKASQDSNVAFELLKCAHKYSIQKLEADVKSIIPGKGADWMDIAGAIRLFFFARNVETLASLRRKAISNLRSNRSNLVTSPEFNELLTEDPATFKVLNDALLLYDE